MPILTNEMKVARELKAEAYRLKVVKFNDDYTNGRIKIMHQTYLKKYGAMTKEWNRMIQSPTVSELIVLFDCKVTRSKTHTRTYIYHGKNFTAEVYEDSCETTWWQAYTENAPEWLTEEYNNWNHHDTKADCLSFLLEIDFAKSKESENN